MTKWNTDVWLWPYIILAWFKCETHHESIFLKLLCLFESSRLKKKNVYFMVSSGPGFCYENTDNSLNIENLCLYFFLKPKCWYTLMRGHTGPLSHVLGFNDTVDFAVLQWPKCFNVIVDVTVSNNRSSLWEQTVNVNI